MFKLFLLIISLLVVVQSALCLDLGDSNNSKLKNFIQHQNLPKYSFDDLVKLANETTPQNGISKRSIPMWFGPRQPMWFGPRLGKRSNSKEILLESGENSIDDQLDYPATVIDTSKFSLDMLKDAPIALVFLNEKLQQEKSDENFAMNKKLEKPTIRMTPRLGRDATVDLEQQRSRPPFAPRLGRTIPFQPRLGRDYFGNF
uniref:Putative pban-type neuropeptides n=1 Tax=Corethrella appendiculata TaxID=1370023 RepID=U5EYW3_9DIPT